MPLAVELRDVSKRFRLHGRPRTTTVKSAIVDLIRRRSSQDQRFAALEHIDLGLEAGRTLGMIGRNGSGKSTLLKLIAGIYRPDTGSVRVQGRVAALIELGAGFHPELTGRENAIINGIMLGLSRREMLRRLDSIVSFAELGGFIDEPARTYSSGMYMRLGFSVAVHIDPDILLIDEVLAVGDESFAKKCADRFSELRRLGKTIVLVTHDTAAVERWCDEALWLDRGRVLAQGLPRKVIDLYHQGLAESESAALARAYESTPVAAGQRWGSGDVEIVRVRLTDANGQERYVFTAGEAVKVRLSYRVQRPTAGVVFGFAVLRADGLWVYGTNTALSGIEVPPLGAAGQVEVTVDRLDLIGGTYFLDVAAHAPDGTPYDYHSRMYPISVNSDSADRGVARLRLHWRIAQGEEG